MTMMTVDLTASARAAAIRGRENLRQGMRVVYVREESRSGTLVPWRLLSNPELREGAWQIRRHILTDRTDRSRRAISDPERMWYYLSSIGVEPLRDEPNNMYQECVFVFNPKAFNELIEAGEIVANPSGESTKERFAQRLADIQRIDEL